MNVGWWKFLCADIEGLTLRGWDNCGNLYINHPHKIHKIFPSKQFFPSACNLLQSHQTIKSQKVFNFHGLGFSPALPFGDLHFYFSIGKVVECALVTEHGASSVLCFVTRLRCMLFFMGTSHTNHQNNSSTIR